jgi:MFS family permease
LVHFNSRLHAVGVTYRERLAAFQPNARLYLLSVVLTGAAMGVYRLLFNFYVLSLGYDNTALGSLVTASYLTALVMAIPMGYVANFMGRKSALIAGSGVVSLAILGMLVWPNMGMFVGMNILMGIGQALSGVTMGLFLMENSGETERVYLFSFSSGLQTGSAFIGNWLGGYLPTWLAAVRHIDATSTSAYAISLALIAIGTGIGVIPLVFLSTPRFNPAQRSSFAPFSYFARKPALLGKLVLPMLVTSIGAGLIMPFMNVFFRSVHHQSDPAIGTLFAWGSLAMGIGLMLAPPLADRMGKIQLVVITQGLSIPFLILLGFSPWFWISALSYYMRLALMNMSGPVYQTFVMEQVEPSARAMVASLVSMASNFGWAFSPTISGWIQDHYGFGPAFLGTIGLYLLSVMMYWGFFWYKHSPEERIFMRQ